jgi:hypothetical protein
MTPRVRWSPLCALLLAALGCGAPSFLATATPTPTHTPQPATTEYKAQPVVLRDFFSEPANDWNDIDEDNRFVTGSVRAQNGKYRWDLKCNEGFVWPSLALENTFTTDFYAAVDARLVSGPDSADYGLLFRHRGGNYYYFFVSATGYYSLGLYYFEKWETLIEWTAASALQTGAVNRLAVGARGSRFDLFINDEYMASAQDERLESGTVGVAVELYNEGDKGVFEFDNFEWRAPKSAITRVTPTPELPAP